jgi:hypothetical protein
MTNDVLPLGLGRFAQGATEYFDYYPETHVKDVSRIVIHVYPANRLEPLPVIVDTAAPWCVFDPREFHTVADQTDPIRATEKPLNIRGMSCTGWLYRISIRLPAVLGESLDVDATVFVPNMSAGEEWFYPNFIGLDGFLNRIRFAIDPVSNLFFFGTLDE